MSSLPASAVPDTHDDAYCPVFHRTVELLGRRWTGVILRVLTRGPARFSTVRRLIPGISDRLLTKRLTELVDEGFVLRCSKDGEPCYGLSELGQGLLPALEAIDAVAHAMAPTTWQGV